MDGQGFSADGGEGADAVGGGEDEAAVVSGEDEDAVVGGEDEDAIVGGKDTDVVPGDEGADATGSWHASGAAVVASISSCGSGSQSRFAGSKCDGLRKDDAAWETRGL